MDWKPTTLGEICDQVGGIIQTGPFGSQLHESDYSQEGIPLVMPKDIIKGRIATDSIARVAPDHVERLSRHKFKSGDIVYGRRGDIGRQALIRQPQAGWLCGTGCLRLSLGDSVIKPLFLHYYLREADVIGWIANQAVGATLPNLNTGILRSVPVRLPPLHVQRKIAAILSDYDDLIENNLRRINILEEMAENLYREWFVKFRFPGHQHARFTDSPFGRLPKGWEEVKVGEILKKVKRGPKIQKKDYATEGSIPIVDQGKEFLGGYTDNTESLISDDLPLIVFGDHTRILKFIDFPFACGADGTQLLKSSDERMPMTLFYYALSSIDISDFAYARHFKFLKEEALVLPKRSIADLFDQFVTPLREQMRSLMQKDNILCRTRDLLLPRLISGKVDVSELDIAVPEEASA